MNWAQSLGTRVVNRLRGVPENPRFPVAYGKALRALIEIQPWCVDHLDWSEDRLLIRGWAIAPDGNHQRYGFRHNDSAFDRVRYPLSRDDISTRFWYLPDAGVSGFECERTLPKSGSADVKFESFSFIDLNTGQQVPPDREYYFCTGGRSLHLPLPQSGNRRRVHGGESHSSFLLEGASIFQRLAVALRQICRREFSDFQAILDWGCGCGRVTRYFSDVSGPRIVGADIDADNISWSRQNLQFAEFVATDLHPPTSFADDSFDLLFGISVFTHLGEAEQFNWLQELKRIASPGAILLMSVHGKTTIRRAGLEVADFKRLQSQGYLDQAPDPILNEVISDDQYYRRVFHTDTYIQDRWSKYFEILDILPGAIGNHQDLVVLRNP